MIEANAEALARAIEDMIEAVYVEVNMGGGRAELRRQDCSKALVDALTRHIPERPGP